MCHTGSYYYIGKDPTFALGTAVPFGPNARMYNAWWFFGGGRELLNDFYKKFNLYAIVANNTGCQMGGWFRKEIREVSDLKGLKFRIGGFAGTVLARLGVIAQQSNPAPEPALLNLPRRLPGHVIDLPPDPSPPTTAGASSSLATNTTGILTHGNPSRYRLQHAHRYAVHSHGPVGFQKAAAFPRTPRHTPLGPSP